MQKKLAIEDIRDVHQQGEIVTIDIKADIDMTTVPVIQAYQDANRNVFQDWKYVIVNMEQVSHIDTAALALFIDCFRKFHPRDGRIFWVNCNEIVHAMFQMSKLDQVFFIMKDKTEALQAIRKFQGER